MYQQERFGNTSYSPPSRQYHDEYYPEYHDNQYRQNYRPNQGGGGGYRNNHYNKQQQHHQQQQQQYSEHGDGQRNQFFEQLYNHFGNKSRNARNMPPPQQEPVQEYGQKPEVCSSSDLLRMNIHHHQPSPQQQRYHENAQYGNNRYRGNYDDNYEKNYHQQYNSSYQSDPSNVADRLSQALFQGAGPRAGDESNNLHALCMRISQHLKEDTRETTKSEKDHRTGGEKGDSAHDVKSKEGEMPTREDCVKAAREIVAMLSAPANEVEFPTSVTLPNVKLRELTNHIPNSHSTTDDLSMPHSYSDDFIARFSALSLFAQQPQQPQTSQAQGAAKQQQPAASANSQAQAAAKQLQQQQKKGDSSAEGSEAGEETGEDEEEESGAAKTGKKRHRKRRKQAKPPCGHDDYKRLRYKHGVTHFLCRACGTKWKQKGFSGEVLQVTPPSADGGV